MQLTERTLISSHDYFFSAFRNEYGAEYFAYLYVVNSSVDIEKSHMPTNTYTCGARKVRHEYLLYKKSILNKRQLEFMEYIMIGTSIEFSTLKV